MQEMVKNSVFRQKEAWIRASWLSCNYSHDFIFSGILSENKQSRKRKNGLISELDYSSLFTSYMLKTIWKETNYIRKYQDNVIFIAKMCFKHKKEFKTSYLSLNQCAEISHFCVFYHDIVKHQTISFPLKFLILDQYLTFVRFYYKE